LAAPRLMSAAHSKQACAALPTDDTMLHARKMAAWIDTIGGMVP
jgi:hypothetical protein